MLMNEENYDTLMKKTQEIIIYIENLHDGARPILQTIRKTGFLGFIVFVITYIIHIMPIYICDI